LERHYRIYKRFVTGIRQTAGGEYLLRSRAHAANDCIFKKDHLKVVDTRDAAFTAIVEPRLRYTSALLSSTQNVHLGQDSPAVRYSEIR
jgi:hypothetical protein